MITPEYLSYRLNLLEVHKKLEESIMADIGRRLAKTDLKVTSTAAWQAEKLQQCGGIYKDILKEVSEITKALESEIEEAFEDAQTEIFNYPENVMEKSPYNAGEIRGLSPGMKSVYRAAVSKTCTDAVNLTKTTALTSQTLFINAADLAHMQVTSGAFSYTSAIANAVRYAAKEGVKVKYPSGTQTSIEAAMRRCVLTGVNQTCGRITEMKAEELNHDIMELTAHHGARPEHAQWQGQLVSRSGKHGYLSLGDIGYGEVTGFMGANCRHNWHMFWEGVSTHAYSEEMLKDMQSRTVEYDGKEYTDYEASQIQRKMEREIRTVRREITGLNAAMEENPQLKTEFSVSSIKLKNKEAKLKDFCKQTGRRYEGDRVQTYGFDRSVSSKAVWANKHLTYIENDAKIKASSGLPKKIDLLDEELKTTVLVNTSTLQGVVPKGSEATEVYVMAGYGTSTPIRDLKRLYITYNRSPQLWQKKSASVYTKNFKYVIHWYEHDGFVPETETKIKGVKKR